MQSPRTLFAALQFLAASGAIAAPAWADLPLWGRQPGRPFTSFFASPPISGTQPAPALAGAQPTSRGDPARTAAPLPAEPGAQCIAAVRTAERAAGIPEFLMAAIARVESGRADGRGGVTPWPWSINAEGVDHVYDTKAAAIAGAQAMQASGTRSMDVGCMQVNLLHHPDAFANLDQAFDVQANARYAARFLTELYAKTGSWQQATARYHSATPELGAAYERKVEAALPEERKRAGQPGAPAFAGGFGLAAPADGAGAAMLGNRAEAARVLPAAPGAISRGLDAYRSMPIPIASARFGQAPL